MGHWPWKAAGESIQLGSPTSNSIWFQLYDLYVDHISNQQLVAIPCNSLIRTSWRLNQKRTLSIRWFSRIILHHFSTASKSLERSSTRSQPGCSEAKINRALVKWGHPKLVDGWATYPSEKYELVKVSWDDYSIPNWMEKSSSHISSHVPVTTNQ